MESSYTSIDIQHKLRYNKILWGDVMNKAEKWVSMPEICDHLGFGKDTVKKLIKEQGLPAYKPDNKIWKFKISEVDEWMKTKRIGIGTATGDDKDV